MARDYNLNYAGPNSPSIVDDPETTVQFVESVILMDPNEIPYGSGQEIGLSAAVFEDLDIIGDDFSLQQIELKLKSLNSSIVLNYQESAVREIGVEEVELKLVFLVDGIKKTLVRRTTK